jgi:hypothetical protein
MRQTTPPTDAPDSIDRLPLPETPGEARIVADVLLPIAEEKAASKAPRESDRSHAPEEGAPTNRAA